MSIYIHVPFCVAKCGYCDFFSVTDLTCTDDYVDALLREISLKADRGQCIETLYFGGGTPSVLTVAQIEKIIGAVKNSFNAAALAEVTLEVNPGTIKASYFNDLKQTGVNRLSIGVQSFSGEKLKFLGRIHTADQAVKAISDARKAGFENVGLDLIYGLPGETSESWRQDLGRALKFMPEHLSCYMLTLEQGTPLYEAAKKNVFQPCTNDQLADLFQFTSGGLTQNGFIHYEISNFAKDEVHFSRHNARYWQRKPYLGFGPAAHSFDGTSRFWNADNLKQYFADINSGKPCFGRELLTEDQAMLESVMLALRTSRGLDINAFEDRFGIVFTIEFKEVLEQIRNQHFCEVKDGRFRLNLEGQTRLNSILEGFADCVFYEIPG